MTQSIHTIRYNSLFNDFLAGKPFLTEFLPPLAGVDWAANAKKLLPVSDVQLQVKQILREQNTDLDSANALKYLADLQDPNTMIIITGQQLGLFLSPAYTIYKALTVVKLVENLNAEYKGKCRFVPVFWLETEDHDFREVNHFGLWDNLMTPVKPTYAGTDYEKKSLRQYVLEKSIDDLIAEVEKILVPTEFSSGLLDLMRKTYAPGSNWVTATRTFFKHLFADTGLLFFEPGTGPIKDLAHTFFTDFLTRTEKVAEIFSTTSQRLAQHGYDLQVPPMPGKTYVHIEDNAHQRSHIYHENGEYLLYPDSEKISVQDLPEIMTKNAQNLSTAVISRPVLQSWLLPVAAYVAGPAEIAYWAQMGGLFNEFNLPMPVVYPRISLTMIEPKIKRFAEKHQVNLAQTAPKQSEFLDSFFAEKALSGQDPFSGFKSVMNGEIQKISHYLQGLDPTLLPATEKMLERILGQIDNLEHKSIQARQRKEQTITSHLVQIHHSLFPEGIPQERFASIIYFLNKFGPGILSELHGKMEVGNFQHQVIYIGD